MHETAIQVRGLSKAYKVGTVQRENKLAVQVLDSLKAAIRRGVRRETTPQQTIWALRNVDFDIQQGESVGIIGRNGAGKSTLLKVLSNITAPTTGRVDVYGQIGSLLEVGTGFHPELTGRENIYLSATIQGMERKAIARRFDEIVDFAGVETFIDTPVKRYSSGMYMRLAFAVSAFVESDILIVDEVLAVGDTEFQKKCISKMQQSTSEGRTLLFVSHQLALLANVCERCILLVNGEKRADGPSQSVILHYMNDLESADTRSGELVWADPATAPSSPVVRLDAIRIHSNGNVTSFVDIDKEVTFEIEYTVLRSGTPLYMSIQLFSGDGTNILATANFKSANLTTDEWAGKAYPEGSFRTTCTLPPNFLNDGSYSISVIILTDAEVGYVEIAKPNIMSFSVRETGEMRAEYIGSWIGMIRPKLAWQTQPHTPPASLKSGSST